MEYKVAIVTGASKGIGLAIANQLVNDNYYVIGTHTQNYDQAFKDNIENENFKLVNLDVTDYKSVVSFAKEIVKDFNKIDLLVNNAGIVNDKLMMSMKLDDFTSVIDVNLVGVFNMINAFTRSMLKARTGSIVNIASVIGEIGNVGQANYAASKAGVIGLSKSLSKEFASRGVRVNCVAPGFIETSMTDSLSDSTKEWILDRVPLKELGQAEDVAYAVSFLASDKAKYITGQVLNVCGGMVV